MSYVVQPESGATGVMAVASSDKFGGQNATTLRFSRTRVHQYKMVLALMGKHPKTIIVPTYDIDNIWHTHMAFLSTHQADCTRIARRAIGHDAGSRLHTGAATNGLEWRKQGAMYRGEPPDL
jgi:hypothetical protein